MARLDSRVATSITLSALAATQVREWFSFSLPTVGAVRSDTTEYTHAEIRQGEITGAGISLLVGALCSYVAHDRLPLLVTVIMTGAMIASYEHAYHHQHPHG